MQTAKHLYKSLLLLYPHSYRNTFGAHMLQTFVDSYTDVAASTGRVGIDFWLFMMTDELKNIMRQHILALREDHRSLPVATANVVVSAVLLIPLFVTCYAIVVSAVLALPHPPVSGIGFLMTLAALLLISAGFSLVARSVLAHLVVRALAKRHKSVS